MKKTLLIAIPAGILLLFFAIHTAQSLPPRHFHRSGVGHDFLEFRLDRLSRELNLTPSQEAKLDDLKKDLETMMEERVERRLQTRKELADQLSARNFNVDTVTGILHNQIDERARVKHQLVNSIAQFCKELTPEQRKILSEKILDRLDDQED